MTGPSVFNYSPAKPLSVFAEPPGQASGIKEPLCYSKGTKGSTTATQHGEMLNKNLFKDKMEEGRFRRRFRKQTSNEESMLSTKNV